MWLCVDLGQGRIEKKKKCEGKSENSEELSGESGSWEFLTKRAVHEKYCFHEKLRLDCLGFFHYNRGMLGRSLKNLINSL